MSGSQLALVQTVLEGARGETTTAWKLALLELKTYAPDAGCVAVVIRAYERGQCEPWCAAALLEAIGHPDGYATALEILQLAPGALAESYAGTALVRMRGADALADLAAVLDDDRLPQRAHEGAARGLAAMADPRADDVLLRAVDRGRIRTSIAGSVASERGIPAARLVSWLRGGDSRRRNLAAWTVFHLAAQGPLLKELEIAMHAALADAPLPFTPEQRSELRERLAN
ncbi:MAG: hypothetical protein JO257_01590 [Deltaproteobacteria bacterium]|nr:hypothetical protein [Deltaproteobacteria bacterium]